MNNFTKWILPLAIVLCTALHVDADTDYCDKTLCSWGTHIACNNKNEFASTCPSDAKLVEITPELQDLIVDKFNEKRNLVAGGIKKSKLRPACRMGTMQWDPELAKLAELNVKQCKMNHDSCHNTETYHLSGQNLAWMTFYNTPNDTEKLTEAVQMWYDEIKDIKWRIIKKYPNRYKGPVIGHFTAMVHERNIAIGCGASVYSETGQQYKSYLVACDFAYTNMMGTAVYKSCKKPSTKCKIGTNPKYPNLCNTSEKYDVNGY